MSNKVDSEDQLDKEIDNKKQIKEHSNIKIKIRIVVLLLVCVPAIFLMVYTNQFIINDNITIINQKPHVQPAIYEMKIQEQRIQKQNEGNPKQTSRVKQNNENFIDRENQNIKKQGQSKKRQEMAKNSQLQKLKQMEKEKQKEKQKIQKELAIKLSKNRDQWNKLLKSRQQIQKYENVDLEQIKELPFCMIVLENTPQSVLQSIRSSNYTNYEFLKISYLDQVTKTINLTSTNLQIKQKCRRNSIVGFIKSAVPPQFLNNLNLIYQTQNTWLTYQLNSISFSVISVYSRILSLVGDNNLSPQKFQSISLSALTKYVLELSFKSAAQLSENSHIESGFSISLQEQIDLKKSEFIALNSMKEYSKDRLQMTREDKKSMYNKFKGSTASKLTYQMQVDSIQFLQLIFLPANHSLADHQRNYYEKKYNFSHYTTELPLCVFVPSHNNIQHNRYEKSFLSIIQQEYDNYRIVFLDDKSDDETLKKTIELSRDLGFPQTKIDFIQNLKRNYATYNIVNAAFNNCGDRDIMVLVDGDDQLVGRQAFKLFNYAYQSRANWLVFTTYIKSDYKIRNNVEQKRMVNFVINNKRLGIHWISHTTTFYVALFKQIKLQDHQCHGEWLRTLYDDAMQHPLVEMTTMEHSSYIGQINYLYNVDYGDNDNSSKQKYIFRISLYQNYIIPKTPYKALEQLDFNYKNKEIIEVLNNDSGKRYKIITNIQDIVIFNKDQAQVETNICKQSIKMIK